MMKVGFIDTSFLLSLVFEDDNFEEAYGIWNELEIFCGSVLLEIEAMINVYKYFSLAKSDDALYREKKDRLRHLLNTVNRKTVDEEVILEIENIERLKHLKCLDSVHLATAHIFAKMIDTSILLCSYDKNMMKAGAELGMSTLHP